jgi:hypothetical protein
MRRRANTRQDRACHHPPPPLNNEGEIMVFAFGFLLAGLIALAATTTPEQASANLKAWLDRFKGAKPGPKP